MKVLAINASPRVDGNTAIAIRKVLSELENQGIETELFQLAGRTVRGCMACRSCFKNKNRKCIIEDDPVNELIEKMVASDGIIMGSPVYYWDVTSEMKALIDRIGFVCVANDHLLKRKLGTCVLALRRLGAVHALDTVNHFFHLMRMVIAGSGAPIVIGREVGEVEHDAEGMQNLKYLGENFAWILEKLHG
jgi:multimeric flavodoxin WrbA